MAGGITVQIDGGEVEREIRRLVASVGIADIEIISFVDYQLHHGKEIARKNIQQYVYALPQGPRTRYKRTMNLLNAVKSGVTHRAGAIHSGQVYISREPFKRVYYPVFVEYGREAGAPYEGRHYWSATIAQLEAETAINLAAMGNRVARRMVR